MGQIPRRLHCKIKMSGYAGKADQLISRSYEIFKLVATISNRKVVGGSVDICWFSWWV